VKVVVDLPEDVMSKLFDAVVRHRYSNASMFVQMAIENQLQLEEESSPAAPMLDELAGNRKFASSLPYEVAHTLPGGEPVVIVPREFGLGANVNPRPVGPPFPPRVPSGPLWGQYNRVFPAKLSLRCLSNLLREGDDWTDLPSFREKASVRAREFGVALDAVDLHRGNKRGEKLSTGLPVGEKDPVAALARFMNQFIGYLTKDDRIEGMLGALRYVNLVKGPDSDERIGITEKGLEFARMENPVLDRGKYDSTLSQEETERYLDHIFDELPEEGRLSLYVLKAIEEGANNPDALSVRIRRFVGGHRTDAVIDTMRSGSLGRLGELGLVDRQREGTSVRYAVTVRGGEVLASRSK